MSSLSEANIKFTLDLFQELRNATGNIFFSPTSITAQLAMVYLGAKGKTAQEIEKVLHFSEITEKSKEKTLTNQGETSGSLHLQFQKLLTEWNKLTDAYELKSANKIYKQKSLQLFQEYLDDLKNFYLTDVESVDFENETEESRKKINTWVEKQTHDKIKEIFPQGSLHSDAKLILVNAVYFKGDWIMKFEGKDTVERKFWLNKDVQAKMLEMPYKGKALSMVVLLPNEVDGLQQLEDKLTVEKLMEWTSLQSMKKTDVNLHLPKFTMEESYNLESKLINMGMKKAFSPQDADLSSMSRDKDLVVSTVTHKAFVKVHEEGAEAAAVSGRVASVTLATIHKDFHCDHPFIFFIKQNSNNNILFFGRVSSP
ncbi:serpin B3 isoform X2 [Fukomys damarensis]|uniref:serpin B3 isoform X2 n=1 Tax=Fukomys damarensis TaxID=885580 RepID=UPI000540091D|nr:serpin B3 isoform X2 [Fukomys damarensis]